MEIANLMRAWTKQNEALDYDWLVEDSYSQIYLPQPSKILKKYKKDEAKIVDLAAKKEELYVLKKYADEIRLIDAIFARGSWSNQIEQSLESISFYIKDEESKDVLKVTLNNELIVELPHQFKALHNSIEKSKYILKLEENWDDEGSPPYKESTWKKAIEFISKYTVWIFSETNKVIDAPQIYHGPNGSIDLLWEKENYRLLIKIPENPEMPASFYGDDYKLQKIKGTFDPSSYYQGLLLSLSWLS